MIGQALFIEHSLMILIGVFIISTVAMLMYSFYLASVRNEVRETLRQLSVQISDNIVKLYESSVQSPVSPKNSSSVLLGEVNLGLPNSVAKRNYEITLSSGNQLWTQIQLFVTSGQNVTSVEGTSGAKITAKSTNIPKVTLEYSLPNIGISLSGKIKNGLNDKLKYYRYNVNGTIYDTIVLGEPELLVSITGVS